MSEYQMAMAALRRPLDYGKRPAQSQWNIDARLGILDWNGLDLGKAEGVVSRGDETTAREDFKMSLKELREVVEGFNEQDRLWREKRAKEKEAKDEH